MGYLSAVFFFSTVYYLWRRSATNLEKAGRGWLFRHWVAGALALTLGLFQTLLFNGDHWLGITLAFTLALGSIFIAGRPSTAAAASVSPVAPSPEYKLSETARAVYEAEPAPGDDPLDRWKDSAPDSPARYGLVADIEFDYRNKQGNDSHRHVAVEAVDREYFQGYCHKASDIRTFATGRVRGKVLDRETGELLAPKAWAAEARKHPLNDPSLISLGDDREDEEEAAAPAAESVEICFTGFAKADKQRLEGMAKAADMTVRQSVTNGLTHLVAGPNAGPTKLARAEEVGAEVIDESGFFVLFSKV